MNNFRFINGGKRKAVIPLRQYRNDAGLSPRVELSDAVAYLVEKGQTPKLIRLVQIDYEITKSLDTPQSDYDVKSVSMQGFASRPALIVANNNTGPDGSYKVPDESIFRKWQAVTEGKAIQHNVVLLGDINISTDFPLDPTAETAYFQVVCYVHLEYVE